MLSKLITRDEAANMLNISIITLKRREAEGLLKPIRMGSRIVRYYMEDIENYLKSYTQERKERNPSE